MDPNLLTLISSCLQAKKARIQKELDAICKVDVPTDVSVFGSSRRKCTHTHTHKDGHTSQNK